MGKNLGMMTDCSVWVFPNDNDLTRYRRDLPKNMQAIWWFVIFPEPQEINLITELSEPAVAPKTNKVIALFFDGQDLLLSIFPSIMQG